MLSESNKAGSAFGPAFFRKDLTMGFFSKYIHSRSEGSKHLDSKIPSVPGNERTDSMKRVKATINTGNEQFWISGNGVQQLVDKAVAMSMTAGSRQLFNPYAEEFISLYKEGGVQSNTLVGYRGYLRNHILPFFDGMAIGDIVPSTIQAYIKEKSKTLTIKTIREHLDLLNQIFDSAEEDGLISRNPCKSKKLKMVGKPSRVVEAYTDDEYKSLELLLDYLTGTERLCLALSLYTGMRQGEFFALTWDHVDLNERLIYVRSSVEWPSQNRGILKEPKTRNGYRDIPIIPQLFCILEEYWQPEGFVLTSVRGDPNEPMTRQAVKRLYERINYVAQSYGISTVFLSHRSRHSVATILNNSGADDVTITSVLGHSDVNFTKNQYVSRQKGA